MHAARSHQLRRPQHARIQYKFSPRLPRTGTKVLHALNQRSPSTILNFRHATAFWRAKFWPSTRNSRARGTEPFAAPPTSRAFGSIPIQFPFPAHFHVSFARIAPKTPIHASQLLTRITVSAS